MANTDSLDLIRISDILDEISGESIGTDQDYGMNYSYLYVGMSGARMIDALNTNFHATDAEFLAQSNAIMIRVISEDIKEIKVIDGIVHYTTDRNYLEFFSCFLAELYQVISQTRLI